MSRHCVFGFALAMLAGGCGSESEPPLTDAVALACPSPGALPFRLESRGFESSANKALAAKNPRIKDEASDSLGNPNGLVANIYLTDDAQPGTQIEFRGSKARTTADKGVFANPLTGESVSTWTYDTASAAWEQVGRGTTDDTGYYNLSGAGFVPANDQPVYAMLEGDGTCTEHRTLLLPTGAKFIVTDIDGTLTTDDGELLKQVTDETYVPAMSTSADRLIQTWASKGYPIVYLTARTHVLRTETIAWLEALGFPPGPVITTAGATEGADVYKTAWLERMIQSFGWVPVAAYGNAATDITAYANAGIPGNRTFIIGGLGGGTTGTVVIPNGDFTDHITSFVEQQPNNN